MKRLSMLAILTFVPIALAKPAAADAPAASPAAKSAETLVQRQLLVPLAAKEEGRSRFSRARLPAAERRVRILDEAAQKDASGATFFTFAIDERHGFDLRPDDESSWRRAAYSGCAYVDRGEVFVRVGDQHRPAAFLAGKKVKPAADGTCHAATAEVAHAAAGE